MGETISVDWDALKAARLKLRKAIIESEQLSDEHERSNLTHTTYKLGSFLDQALHGAISALDALSALPDNEPKSEL